ncbi:Putative transposase (identified by ISEscan HMM) [Escherichia coli]|nr:Putative transposase (identified by ISEscan HMM) [Escherichia coli]
MSHQLTFADSEFSSKRRQTRKEIFLSRMGQILPWQNMVEVIEPFTPRLKYYCASLIRWKPCYAFTACSISGTT